MQNMSDFYPNMMATDKLAVLALTFIAGLFFANFLKTRGLGGCLTYLLSLVVVIIVVSALVKGYSYLLQTITYNLEQYIYFNSIGIIGFVAGLLLGIVFFKRK